MRALANFIVRLVGYALVLGIVARVAAALWVQFGLDGSVDLQPLHDLGLEVMFIAPLPLALFGFGKLRQAALFIGAFLVGAAITAPFAIARWWTHVP